MSNDVSKVATQQSWFDKCIHKYKGEIKTVDPTKITNYILAVKEHSTLNGVFSWDEFALNIKVVKCPPWESEETFKVHVLEDDDITMCASWMEKISLAGEIEKTFKAIRIGAKENAIHPARDYFDSLKWDGTERLKNWLSYHCGCEEDDPEYLAAVGTKWLTAAVARVYEPGCKFDSMLILEGDQNIGKSAMLRELSTFGDEGDFKSYFLDSLNLMNAESPDELSKTKGKLIIEIAELANFHKKDENSLKRWITIQEDEYRNPYDRLNVTVPRQFVLAGTINPIEGYLHDSTGNRRFWPVACGKNKIDLLAVRKIKGQLWAEAVHRYKNKEPLYMTEDLFVKSSAAAERRMIRDVWEEAVFDWLGLKEFASTAEILSGIGIQASNKSGQESRRIAKIMTCRKWVYGEIRVYGKRTLGWKRPQIIRDDGIEIPVDTENVVPIVKQQQQEIQYEEIENF